MISVRSRCDEEITPTVTQKKEKTSRRGDVSLLPELVALAEAARREGVGVVVESEDLPAAEAEVPALARSVA